jgi:hypothetical protein
MPPFESAPVVQFRSITLYPPGHPPIEIAGAAVIGTRAENGVTLVVTRDSAGRMVSYVGMPYVMLTEESPSGLVAPPRRL